MAYGKSEKISKDEKNRHYKKYCKRKAHKSLRILSKRFMDYAPYKYQYYGYS
jgi:hypothetical protein